MVIAIDQNWLDKNQNSKADQAFFTRLIEYPGRAIGALRSLSLIRTISRIYNEVVAVPSPALRLLEKNLGTAMSGIGLVNLPSATKEAYLSLSKLGQNDGVSPEKKTSLAVRSVLDAVSSWGLSWAFLFGTPLARQTAALAEFGFDATDLGVSIAEHNQALHYEEVSTGQVKEAFAHTRKYQMLRIAKAILSIATGVLALLSLFFGMTILPAILSLLLAATATMVAARRDLLKEEGKYQVIDLSQSIRV